VVTITRIDIRGFRNIKHVELEPTAGGMFLTGLNGSGKSSILDAIRFALLGYCQHTDRRGAGAKLLIRHGAEQACIALDLAGGPANTELQVRVTIPASGSVRWSATSDDGKMVAAKPNQLWPWIGVTEASLTAALLPGEHVTSQGLEGVLSELHAGAVEMDALRDACGVEFSALTADYSNPRELSTINALRTIGDDAYAARREIGRQVKTLEAQLTEAPEPPRDKKGNPLTLAAVPKLEANIHELADTRDALLREQGEAGARKEVVDTAALQNELRALAESRHEAQKDFDAARGDLNAAIYRRQAAEVGFDASDGPAMEAELERIAKSIEGYVEGEKCHTCGAKWTETRVKNATAKLRSTRMELSEKRKAWLDKKQRLDGALSVEARAQEVCAAAMTERNKLDVALAEKQRALDEAAQQVPSRDPADIEADLTDVSARIESAKNARAQLALMREHDRRAREFEALQTRHAHLDWRVKAFRDGEVLNNLGGDGLAAFVASVNATLENLGYTLGAEVRGKTIDVSLARAGEEPRPIERASSGEQKLAELAVAVTFAESVGVALVDDLDRLDFHNRSDVLRELNLTEDLQIITAAAHNMQLPVRSSQFLQAIWMDGGEAATVKN
jgi:hypothetical protein